MAHNPDKFTPSRRQFLGLAGAAGAGVLLASCTSNSSAGHPASGSASGKPKRGGTFRIGVDGGSSTENLDPENAHSIASVSEVAQTNETLLEFDHNFKRQYKLAESLEPNADATVWTLRLKPGIEFHNGKTMGAEDVIYTLRAIAGPKSIEADKGSLSTLDLANLKARDKLTVEIPFTSPLSYLPDIFALNASDVVRIMPVGFDPHHPIGTGPFVYQSFAPGQQASFKRNPNYWQHGKPYFDAVHILEISDDSARLNALVSGQVDAIVDVSLGATSTVTSNPNLMLLNSPTGGFNPLTMRIDVPPFNDVNVRQAMKYIADRPALVTASLNGYGSVANDLYGRYDPDYDSAIPQRTQDLDKAKFLLKKSGNEHLQVNLTTADFAAGMVPMATVFAQQASQAGVKVNINNVPADQFFPKYALKVPFSVDNWSTRTYLLQATASMTPSSTFNETHWRNAKWWSYVKKASQTTNESLRKELIHEAQMIEWNEGGYLIWGWFNTVDAYNKRVSGFEPDHTGIHFDSYSFQNAWFNS